jgi:hypothetical protein
VAPVNAPVLATYAWARSGSCSLGADLPPVKRSHSRAERFTGNTGDENEATPVAGRGTIRASDLPDPLDNGAD